MYILYLTHTAFYLTIPSSFRYSILVTAYVHTYTHTYVHTFMHTCSHVEKYSHTYSYHIKKIHCPVTVGGLHYEFIKSVRMFSVVLTQ